MTLKFSRRSVALRWLAGAAAWTLTFSSVAAPPDTAGVSSAARTTINAADAAWLPAMQRGDAAAIAAPYADDGLFVTQSGDLVRGRSAIQDLYSKRLGAISTINGRLVQESLVASGDLVYEWGHATTTVELKDGTRKSGNGAYLSVWKRGPSGTWQIIRNLVF